MTRRLLKHLRGKDGVRALARPITSHLVVEYDHNTNPLGRTRSGAVTTLPDDALTFRGQVAF